MSQTYIATIVSILSVVLPYFGVKTTSEEVNSVVQAIVVAVMGIWIMIRRYKQGDINVLGAKK